MIKTINIKSILIGTEHSPIYDYSALETLQEFQALANEATLIWFVDINQPEHGSIVFGKEILRAIAQRAVPSQNLVPLIFAIDPSERSHQLEHLIAAVRVTKGFDEYE